MLRPQSLSNQVYEHLLRRILSGELAPGSPLQETELSARLGVSRTPIREALGRLAEYGVVEDRPNHSAVVRRLGREELIHIHQVREALEGMAVVLACGRITGADFARLDALAEAASRDDSPDYFEAFDAFDVGLHSTVAERSGNPILAREIRKLQAVTMLIHDQVESVLLGDHRIGPGEPKEIRKICWAQHVAIVDALKAEDAVESRLAMVRHVRESCAYKVRLMPGPDPADAVGGPPTDAPAPPRSRSVARRDGSRARPGTA